MRARLTLLTWNNHTVSFDLIVKILATDKLNTDIPALEVETSNYISNEKQMH